MKDESTCTGSVTATHTASARPTWSWKTRVKAGLTGQTVPGRRIPGHWLYPGPEELAEAEPVGPDSWTFLSFNYRFRERVSLF